ncbi:hypothetical protein ACWGPT_04935 [Pseudorhizobium sp. NPDC055634]
MTSSMTDPLGEKGSSGRLVSLLCIVFIACLPFSTVSHIGLLGNFDSNLSLYPFVPLFLIVLISGIFTRTLLQGGPEGDILRTLFLMFIAVAVFTVINGFWLKSLGYSAYGLDPLHKSLVTSIVPLLIAALYITTAALARYMEPGKLEAALMLGFWLAVGYAGVQVMSYLVPNALYSAVWPWVEGAKDRGGVPYFSIYQRVNGPTSEPAEFVKTLLILYLPWIIYPLDGKIRWGKFVIVTVLTGASQSITGYVILAFVFAMLFFSGRVNFLLKASITYLVLTGLVLVVVTDGEILGGLSERLSRLGEDASANVRAIYNLTALQVAGENPLIGIGWSNEVFIFPQRLADAPYLWEIRQNLEDGVALTAKSLLLRLLMYTGIPLFAIVLAVIVLKLVSGRLSGSRLDITRTRLTFMLLFIGGVVDGGIVTSFYIWAATALPLGYQMRRTAIIDTARTSRRPTPSWKPARAGADPVAAKSSLPA